MHKSLVLFVHCDTQLCHVRSDRVVSRTVRENELHIVHILTDPSIFVIFQLSLDGSEVHGSFDDLWVVWDLQLLPVHRLRENVRLRLPAKVHQQSARSLLPLVKNRGILRHVRNR